MWDFSLTLELTWSFLQTESFSHRRHSRLCEKLLTPTTSCHSEHSEESNKSTFLVFMNGKSFPSWTFKLLCSCNSSALQVIRCMKLRLRERLTPSLDRPKTSKVCFETSISIYLYMIICFVAREWLSSYQSYIQAHGLLNCPGWQSGVGASISNGL